ncbi:hypothetical protein DFO66_10616 [Brevibacterium sanguinis]|uniref:YCII-related domain-containing protein n=2 Tax=Brevibacterium TaxID=1696 RepID=A0A366IKS6_9MICO|nr:MULTISPECIES: YciI family protein [Brevibacterium]RBP64618.1 hypothetical protein DFO66_10616 [Brevibacterium sanguinis]RBP71739.1 hypothetical protein DFO65_105345 [Brevibacterium celere]
MPVFAVNYVYGSDTETRMAHRPAHRSWQSELHESGVVLASGPVEGPEGPGGLLVFRAADRAEVESLLGEDPYASIDVIDSVTIREWTPVFGPFSES